MKLLKTLLALFIMALFAACSQKPIPMPAPNPTPNSTVHDKECQDAYRLEMAKCQKTLDSLERVYNLHVANCYGSIKDPHDSIAARKCIAPYTAELDNGLTEVHKREEDIFRLFRECIAMQPTINDGASGNAHPVDQTTVEKK